jgi:hypothetical protein
MVEVEKGLPNDPHAFAAMVQRTLGDPRSWGHGGRMSFRRVAHPPVAFRVSLASRRTVNRLCAPLDTNGRVSCYNGRGRSVINQARWELGIPEYQHHLVMYRHYVINHEVGHALGHHHVYHCGPGRQAPVMMQQTYGLQGCRRNAWPLPFELSSHG